MRGVWGLLLCLPLVMLLGERPARAEERSNGSTWELVAGMAFEGGLNAAVPVPHVEFGEHHATMLAWPLRPASLVADLTRKRTLELRLTPSVEPQYSFAHARRLLFLSQASLSYSPRQNDEILWSIEGGRVLGSDGDGWVAGTGVSLGAGRHEVLSGSVGLIARNTWLDGTNRFDVGLDFHIGFDLRP